MGWVFNARSRPLYPGERPSFPCTGWVGSNSVWRGVGSLAHTATSRFTYYANPAHPIHVEYVEIPYLFTLKAMFTVSISIECFVFFLLSSVGDEHGSYGSLEAETNQWMEWNLKLARTGEPNVNALLKISPQSWRQLESQKHCYLQETSHHHFSCGPKWKPQFLQIGSVDVFRCRRFDLTL